MLIDCSGLRLSETDKVDDVGEDFDKAVVSRFEEVIEGEIRNPALQTCQSHYTYRVQCAFYLNEQFPQRHVKAHQIPRIGRHNLHVFPANVLRSSTHGRFDRLPCCIHEQFRKPFEDFLDLLRVGLLQILL